MVKKRKPLLKGGQGTTNPLPPTRKQKANQAMYGLENMASSYINPYSDPTRNILGTVGRMQVGDQVVNPNALSLLHNANNTLDNIVRGTVGALIPGGSTPLRDKIRSRRAKSSRGQEAYDENVEALSRSDERSDRAAGGVMTAEERKEANSNDVKKSALAFVKFKNSGAPTEEIDRRYNSFIKNAKTVGFSQNDVDFEIEEVEEKEANKRRKEALEPLKIQKQIEVLKGNTDRDPYAEGGAMDEQMSMLMEGEETHTMPDGTEMAGATHGEYEEQMELLMDKETPMLPDEEMEEDYVDYVMEETLSNEDRNYLIDVLEKDDRLSMIFDQVVESATEFSGSGPIEGPGSEKSDSIPARLSDGEFVITAKATEEIGSDNLMSMMKDAEAGADIRQNAAYGGMVEEEGDPKATPIQTTGLLAAQGNIPNVAKPNRQVEEEMLKASPRRYYVPLSG